MKDKSQTLQVKPAIKHQAVRLILMLFLMAPAVMASAQNYNMYEPGTLVNKKDTLHYRILFPENFNPAKKYPVVFVLHGAGERGNDNKAQLKNGASLFLQVSLRDKYPAIVVFPQCPANDSWSDVIITKDAHGKDKLNFQAGGEPTKAMTNLIALTSQMLDKPYVDKNRVYIGGISIGAMGTFEILGRKPNIFAAAFTIAGGDNTANAKKYATKVPLWIFHGEKDDIVAPEHSEVMVVAIKRGGGKPKFTLYANDGHNSWDHAFAEPQLLPWLFSNVKQ
jgi:predicted peptidase